MPSKSDAIVDRPGVRLLCSALSSLAVHVGALCAVALVTWTQSEWAEPEPTGLDVSLQLVVDGEESPTFQFPGRWPRATGDRSLPVGVWYEGPIDPSDDLQSAVVQLARPERTDSGYPHTHCIPGFTRCGGRWRPPAGIDRNRLGEAGNTSRAGNGRGAGVGDFFGEKGLPQANSIVFVVDRSGSMDVVSEAIKVELAQAIDKLGPAQQFNIVWFADGEPLAFAAALVGAGDANERLAFKHLTQVAFTGIVDPRGALFDALDLKPELIYVLTDGNFETELVDAVTKRNAGRTRINVIGFVIGGGEGQSNLKRLAEQNRGTFKDINAVKLAVRFM